jgi:hypothetical protein
MVWMCNCACVMVEQVSTVYSTRVQDNPVVNLLTPDVLKIGSTHLQFFLEARMLWTDTQLYSCNFVKGKKSHLPASSHPPITLPTPPPSHKSVCALN